MTSTLSHFNSSEFTDTVKQLKPHRALLARITFVIDYNENELLFDESLHVRTIIEQRKIVIDASKLSIHQFM